LTSLTESERRCIPTPGEFGENTWTQDFLKASKLNSCRCYEDNVLISNVSQNRHRRLTFRWQIVFEHVCSPSQDVLSRKLSKLNRVSSGSTARPLALTSLAFFWPSASTPAVHPTLLDCMMGFSYVLMKAARLPKSPGHAKSLMDQYSPRSFCRGVPERTIGSISLRSRFSWIAH
jgi:hypothetical protein